MRLPAKSFLFILLLLLPAFLKAQEVRFTANPLQTTVGVGRSFQVTYNLDNAGSISSIELLPQNAFTVAPGFSDATRTSTQILNGTAKTTQTYSRTYTFQATEKGTANLPVAIATTASGATYRTAAIPIKVVDRNSAPAQQRAADPFGGVFGGPNPFGGAPNSFEELERLFQRQTLPTEAQARERAHMFVQLSKSTVWLGEPVLLRYLVRTTVNIQGTGSNKIPSPEGLWMEPVTNAPRSPGENVIHQVIAIRQRAGTLTIPPAQFEVSANVLGASGQAVRKNFMLVSAAQQLEVRPLPQPQPPAFKGAVGLYEMTTDFPVSTLPEEGAALLRIRISGRGALSQLEAPRLLLPAGLSAGEPRVQDQISDEGGTLRGWREFQYTVSAEKKGTYTLPAVAFAFFNPQTARYQTLQSKTYSLSVTPGAKEEAPSVSPTGGGLWTGVLLVVAGLLILGAVLRLVLARKRAPDPQPEEAPVPPIIVAPATGATVPEEATEPVVNNLRTAVSGLKRLQPRLPAHSFMEGEVAAFLQVAEAFLYGGGAGTETGLYTEAMDLLRRAKSSLHP